MEIQRKLITVVQAEIDACRERIRACEKSFRQMIYSDSPEWSDEHDSDREALAFRLQRLHQHMLVAIERFGLPNFFESYRQGFSKFEPKLNNLVQGPDDMEVMYSPALIYIDNAFDAISPIVEKAPDEPIDGALLLDRVLRQLPYVLHQREFTPKSEKQVGDVIYEMLTIVFADVLREVPIPQIMKTYKADFAIESLSTAIEIKYAVNMTEVKASLDGIFSDMKGYHGDRWTKFIAVLYTTEPLVSPDQMEAQFKRAGANWSWRSIVVHGPGSRRKKAGTTST